MVAGDDHLREQAFRRPLVLVGKVAVVLALFEVIGVVVGVATHLVSTFVVGCVFMAWHMWTNPAVTVRLSLNGPRAAVVPSLEFCRTASGMVVVVEGACLPCHAVVWNVWRTNYSILVAVVEVSGRLEARVLAWDTHIRRVDERATSMIDEGELRPLNVGRLVDTAAGQWLARQLDWRLPLAMVADGAVVSIPLVFLTPWLCSWSGAVALIVLVGSSLAVRAALIAVATRREAPLVAALLTAYGLALEGRDAPRRLGGGSNCGTSSESSGEE